MTAAASDPLGQVLKNLALIALSLVLLPIDTALLAACYARQRVRPSRKAPGSVAGQSQQRRTILVTGVGMTKGLVLARLFHKAGHRVVGADFSPRACGSRSRALAAYHVLQRPGRRGADPYLDSILKVINRENVHLWVSCSGVGSAVEDGVVKEVVEARTRCKAVQFDVARTRTLHEKDRFIDHTQAIGLRIPESYLVTSRNEMLAALENAAGLSCNDGRDSKSTSPDSKGGETTKQKRFIAKSVGVNDRVRGDMTLLPLPAEKQTYDFVYRLEWLGMSDKEPWLLQEFIQGREFCTHSLVVRGEVRAFVACRSAELLMHYVALPADSPLTVAMLDFTRTQAASFGEDFTGHLSFDFMVSDADVVLAKISRPENLTLYPIECNPRAHTAVALFGDTPELVGQYLAVLDGAAGTGVVTPEAPEKYYWVGHDLVTLFLLPTLRLLLFRISIAKYVSSLSKFAEHVLFWKDGTFEVWDPLPAWWLYHVYWPLTFWDCMINGRAWSRINVSTTKMFECD
ncbi:catechol o-methyltransferase [Colletotrichum musicola]|uniref:Catechol o-methyltransferase n=1 Tax=Colletotrichum musicola TaxID=2175873 RepID=A0A8H6U8G0_9PEZI|nr:catechol o-methyltransferase [Colletotrichum musicola]